MVRLSNMRRYGFESRFKSRKDLKQFGSNALILFALQLFFGIDDITAIATDDVIVDGPDDGGLDLVYIDKVEKCAVIAQGYETRGTKRRTAPAKKARDLSNGLSLLLKVPIGEVPRGLRSSAEELRMAILNGEIEKIHIWYVHNLPGSKNVERELRTVEQTAHALLKDSKIKEIISLEVCAEIIEKRYETLFTPILVKEKFKIPFSGGIQVKSDNWKAFVTSVPLNWLYSQFKNYGTDLFSANVRDYLGISKKSDKNINMGIQETASKDPGHFWVFNNGVTALVNSFKISKDYFYFNGFSILNGAQTTGAVGNLVKPPNKSACVQIRFVKCNDKKTVVNIKRYNNSQNKIEAPDFRSSDKIQEGLVEEFRSTDVNYLPRRGGIEDIIKRKPNTLPSVLAGQVLAAFHKRPDIAYHQKTEIWENDSLYGNYFNEHLKAKHLIFAYSLFEAVKNKKLLLSKKNKNDKLTSSEVEQLSFFQTRGSVFLLTAAIANCLEIFLGQSIPNPFHLKFRKDIPFRGAVVAWEPIIDAACYFVSHLNEGFSEGAVREKQAFTAIKKFTEFMGATKQSNKIIYSNFSDLLR